MGFDGFGKRDGLDTSSSATVIDGVVQDEEGLARAAKRFKLGKDIA